MTQSSKRPLSMQNRIIIFIDKGRCAWLIRNAAGETHCVLDGELSQLPKDEQDEIGVVVPAEGILLTEADLPRLSAYRLQQALPFALEEQVLDDLELLHFASGPYPAAASNPTEKHPTHLPVAIVKKTQLELWLQLLQAQGIQPDWLTSAVFTLPCERNQWQLRVDGETVTVRTGPYAGFSVDLANLNTLLHLKQQETLEPIEKGVVYHDPQQALSLASSTLPLQQVALSAEESLIQAAAALEKNPPLNLLQGAYLSKRKFRASEKNKKAWRLAGFAFALWLGLLFVGKIGSWLILSWEHHHLQSSMAHIYQAHLSAAAFSGDPKRKLEAQLKKALTQNERNRLFQWLGDLAKASAPGRLQGFNFQNKQLTLEWTAPSFTALDDFILSLKAQGIEVHQQSAVLAGNQIKAVLLIEGTSP